MKLHSILLLSALWGVASATAQTSAPSQCASCQPSSPIVIDKAMLMDEAAIRNKILAVRPRYNSDSIRSLRSRVNTCKESVTGQITALENDITANSLRIQQLLGLRDVQNLRSQIAAKQESKKASERELDQSLGKTKHSGLFAVVLQNIDPYSEKAILINQAANALKTKAVDNLNGVYIKRLTEVSNLQQVNDIIRSYTRGEVTTATQHIAKVLYDQQVFVYFAKINVSPLKEPLGSNKTGLADPVEGSVVIDVLNELDYRTKLQKANVPNGLLSEIENLLATQAATVRGENDNADKTQRMIMDKGNAEIQRLNDEIAAYQKQLDQILENLKNGLKDVPGVTYDPANPEKSADAAIAFYRKKISDLAAKWNGIKECELEFKETNVSIENAPAADIAKKTIDLYQQMMKSDLVKVSKIDVSTVIENLAVKEFSADEKVDVYREIEKLWLYPVPDNEDNYRLAVVAKFKIKEGTKPPASSPTPTTTSTPPPAPIQVVSATPMQQTPPPSQSSTTLSGTQSVPASTTSVAKTGKTRYDMASPVNTPTTPVVALDYSSDNFVTDVRLADGSRYTGGMRNDVPHGNGKIVYPAGHKFISYEGQLYNGIPHGYGEYRTRDGRTYVGNLDNGERHGEGKLSYSNGNWYQGNFVRGEFEGKGMFYDAGTGKKYDGEWARGKENGYGTLFDRWGTIVQRGMWTNGICTACSK